MDTKVMDTLKAGGTLRFGDKLRSNNGNHELVMQHDGNLVLYQGIPHGPAPVWDTGTSSLPQLARPTHANMQEDGNLVLYDSLGNPTWHSGTSMHPGSKLVLQDDRNLVIYDADDRAVWASNTATPIPVESEDSHSAESVVKGIVEWETVGQKWTCEWKRRCTETACSWLRVTRGTSTIFTRCAAVFA